MWQQETFHYRAAESIENLTAQYELLLRNVERLKKEPGLSAAVYTQTTDVEGENNGLVTYDREVVKVNVERVARANRGELPPTTYTVLSATAEYAPQEWRYTTTQPAAGWEKPDFVATSWPIGSPTFANKEWFLVEPRTGWSTPDLWMRREFTVPETLPQGRYVFILHYDDEAEIYINGVKAAELRGMSNYHEIDLTPETKAALHPGRNVLAVHARSTGGSQSVDVGIAVVEQ